MPRTLIPNAKLTPLPPTGPLSDTALNRSMTPADPINGNYFLTTGRDLVTVYNSDTSPHTLSIVSAPDDVGRLDDVVDYVIPAQTHAELLIMPVSLYTQSNKQVWFNSDSALVLFMIRSF